jgi:hypothetical protein
MQNITAIAIISSLQPLCWEYWMNTISSSMRGDSNEGQKLSMFPSNTLALNRRKLMLRASWKINPCWLPLLWPLLYVYKAQPAQFTDWKLQHCKAVADPTSRILQTWYSSWKSASWMTDSMASAAKFSLYWLQFYFLITCTCHCGSTVIMAKSISRFERRKHFKCSWLQRRGCIAAQTRFTKWTVS